MLKHPIVGKKSNPCYSQSTYGTKIQNAMKIGVKIISEDDYNMALKKLNKKDQ